VAQCFETVFAGDVATALLNICSGISAICPDDEAHYGRMNAGPQTQVDEIAPDIFRMSTWVPDITENGFTFNQFLLTGDEPMLFHCGHRQLFPLVSAAINQVVPLEKLRWISFGHIEADECGAMNLLLAAAPNAEVIHGALACMVSLTDLCDRPPVVAPEDGVHDIGGHRLRFIPTPHVPHNWEAGLWFDETTSTLLAGDLFTHTGQCPSLTESDCVAPALDAENFFHATGLTTNLQPTLEQLAELNPTTLAIMHGSSYTGDGAAQLRALAEGYAAMAGTG
jgi:flavorubredoxin